MTGVQTCALPISLQVNATGQASGLAAVNTFTDATQIQSVTLNGTAMTGSNSITVVAGSSITVTMTVKNTANDNWRASGYQVYSGTLGSSYLIVDTPDHDGNTGGTDAIETFTITAPATSGSFNSSFTVYQANPPVGSAASTRTFNTSIVVVAQPVVSIAVSPTSVTEDGTPNLVYTFTRSNVAGGALTVNYAVGGTATFIADYAQTGAASFSSSAGTVTFAAGSTTATVTIDPTNDARIEAIETATLALTSGTGYTVGLSSAAIGTITDNDSYTVALTAPGTTNVSEGSGVSQNVGVRSESTRLNSSHPRLSRMPSSA